MDNKRQFVLQPERSGHVEYFFGALSSLWQQHRRRLLQFLVADRQIQLAGDLSYVRRHRVEVKELVLHHEFDEILLHVFHIFQFLRLGREYI